MRRYAGTGLATSLIPFEPIHLGAIEGVECASCQGFVDVHQPDVDRPDRLLGACPECGAWYLIDHEAGVMLPLPDLRATREG
jgi:hypothetical protein